MPPSMTPHVDLYNIVRETRTAIAYAKSHALDSLLDDLERLAQEWSWMPDAAPDADDDKAPSPEPVDADEYRAMVRPAAPAPAPEPDEFAVVRAAPPAAPEVTPEPPKRPRRRTPPPAPAPLPGPVDEAVEGDEGDGFGSIPF